MRFTIAATVVALSALTSIIAAPLPDGGSAYTGAGGQAVGGSHNVNDYSGGMGGLDVLNIAGDNAGDGGRAVSGTAVGGSARNGNGGSAYSGAGGNTNGGNVNENHIPRGGYYGWGAPHGLDGLDGIDALNIANGNAGDGGDSSTGNAYGGSSFNN